jgi:hypothetical protein
MNTTGARPLAFACSTCRVSRSMTPTKGFSFPRATPGQPRVRELRQYDRQDIATHTGPQEPGSRAAAVHRGREGPHGAVGDRKRIVQAPATEPGGHRDRKDPQPRSLANHRQRLARGGRTGARVRQALRLRHDRSARFGRGAVVPAPASSFPLVARSGSLATAIRARQGGHGALGGPGAMTWIGWLLESSSHEGSR